MPGEDVYLGDGVYLNDDGHQIWLAANNHNNRVIALEPEVCRQLLTHFHRIMPIEQLIEAYRLAADYLKKYETERTKTP